MKQDLRYQPRHARHSTRRGGASPPSRRRRWSALVALFAVPILVAIAVAVGASGVLDRSVSQVGGLPRTPVSVVPATSGLLPSGRPPSAAALPRHRLTVRSHPAGASLRLGTPDGSTRTVRTPFKGRVAEGRVELTLRLKGYNPLTEYVDLRKNRTLDLWLDPAGLLHHQLDQFKVGPAPKQVAFTPDGDELWVTDLGGDGVEVYDAQSGKRLGDVSLADKGAVEVIFTDDGATAYVSQMQTASVYEIDTATREVKRHLFTSGSWSKVMALSPEEQTLFVANWVSDDVSQIDLVTGKEVRRFPTVDTPRGLYVTPNGKRLYVAGFESGEIQRFDLRTLESKVLIRTGGAMRHLVGDPVRGLLYADDMAQDKVFVVDLATGKARMLARTDNTPNTIDLSPDGRVLYVSNRGRNNPKSYYLPGPEWGSVLAIDTATGKPLDAIVGGNQTTGLDVSDDGRFLAFSDFLDNRVTIFAIPDLDLLLSGDGGRYRAHLADLAK
ncbi:MAG: YncE family protein [Actinomycetota bacterium]